MANKNNFENKDLLLLGVASLLWFIFRTGTKPSRIVYPCQRAALANSSMLLSISIPLSITVVFTKTKKLLSKKGMPLVLLIILASAVISNEQIWGSLQPVKAVNPYQEIELKLRPRNATAFPSSDIYVVNGHASAHISELLNLMGSHDLLFYKSSTIGVNQGPDGLIARDDVVLIKINEQWNQRGGTNTDVLKELIEAIVDHPDGFVGEIVVADNGQGYGSMNWPQSNAENHAQSTQDVVDMFLPYYKVSTYDWQPIRGERVNEYSEGDMTSGYILYDIRDPETGIYVSYPKFETESGTFISFKSGIWNGTGYEKRLKVINVPVLKSHWTYGVTASLKHYMGVQSEGYVAGVRGGLANGHNTVGTGGMGTLMVETGLPTLNIIDAIWINANPYPSGSGPETHYSRATRVNVLMASTDPVALDYWAAKHVLVQAASLIGYDDTHTLDPDNTHRSGLKEAFGVWLTLTKNAIIAGGYNATTDENRMNVYVSPEPIPPKFTLAVDSSPIEVTFTFDDISCTTPWSGTYDENTSVEIVMPEIHTANETRYYWGQWSDEVTNRSRTVTMDTNITLTAYFNGPYHELTVKSSPVTGVAFIIDGVPEVTSHTEWLVDGTYLLEMPEMYDGYVWSHWLEDGDANRTKTITLSQGTVWTGVFAPAPPWTFLFTVLVSVILITTLTVVVYVRYRKKQQT
jgi:hypothetical protein